MNSAFQSIKRGLQEAIEDSDLRALVQRLRVFYAPSVLHCSDEFFHESRVEIAGAIDGAANELESLLARADADHRYSIACERERDEAMRRAEAAEARLRDLTPTCAVCGRAEPCESDPACTFDPSPKRLYKDNCQLRVKLTVAEMECARLRQDAERYRHIRSCFRIGIHGEWVALVDEPHGLLDETKFDAAIDRAIAEGKHEAD